MLKLDNSEKACNGCFFSSPFFFFFFSKYIFTKEIRVRYQEKKRPERTPSIVDKNLITLPEKLMVKLRLPLVEGALDKIVHLYGNPFFF